MNWITLILNYIVGGYALYRIAKEINLCYKINGFGLYLIKFHVITLVKWAVIIAIVQNLFHFILTKMF
jgi:hypothetical protein